MMPSQAFGPAGTDTTAVVVLSIGGTITLTFDSPITDGASWDFAVFENGFASDIFLELGFVEVSSDGSHFARFDSAFQSAVTPCGSCSGTAAQIGGLAGAYMVGYGTPFDLAALHNSPLVRDGSVDLTAIKYPNSSTSSATGRRSIPSGAGSSIRSPAGRLPASTSTASPFSTSGCDDARYG